MKKITNLLLLSLIVISLQGCSVMMAASGQKEANISSIVKGDSRQMVKAKIGGFEPSSSASEGNKVIDSYELTRGDEPSAGRAVGHAVLDLCTLTLWELIGTPIELSMGEKYYLTCEYENDQLIKYSVSSSKS